MSSQVETLRAPMIEDAKKMSLTTASEFDEKQKDCETVIQ